MITISKRQMEDMTAEYQKDFLLEVVCDWYALYESVYERPAKIPFDEAWEVAEYLLERLESVPQEWEREVGYELIHQVLLAAEQGWSLDQLPAAVDQFCMALPAYEAAFALLRIAFMPGEGSPANDRGERL
jgi:hypothetical protein